MKVLIFIHVMLLGSCHNRQPCESITLDEYETFINRIKEKVVDLTWLQEPWTYPEFQFFLTNPACYCEVILAYIDKNSNDELGIEISLLGLKHLNFDDSILFTTSIINREISENLLAQWIAGNYGNYTLAMNYKSSEVTHLLNGIIPQSQLMPVSYTHLTLPTKA